MYAESTWHTETCPYLSHTVWERGVMNHASFGRRLWFIIKDVLIPTAQIVSCGNWERDWVLVSRRTTHDSFSLCLAERKDDLWIRVDLWMTLHHSLTVAATERMRVSHHNLESFLVWDSRLTEWVLIHQTPGEWTHPISHLPFHISYFKGNWDVGDVGDVIERRRESPSVTQNTVLIPSSQQISSFSLAGEKKSAREA